jgi:NAD(P)-dependent dehydrogenase (short-subunit alcohol dehydrogenase family)
MPDKKVVWLVLDNYFNFTEDKSEWKGTKITFEVAKKDDTTQVRFSHLGLVPEYECYDVCSNAWGSYVSGSLRSLITTGGGRPNPKEKKEDTMLPLTGKNMVVIGASRGVGRQIVETAIRNGAHVLAVARREAALRQLAEEITGVEVLSIDATDEDAPSKVFEVLQPHILVVCAGAFSPAAPIHQQSWQEFSVNWETDVKIAFHFAKAALLQPLAAGSSVILISSGAALAGSPNSGGYAGAKRTQLFIANYSQKESDRQGLGMRFTALAPRMMPDTELGKRAVAGYSGYLGISEADFIRSMPSPPAPSDVANGVIELVTTPDRFKGNVCVVSGKGLEVVPS